MTVRTSSLVLLAALLLAARPVPAGQEAPVLVELFTSQGCSSCPPADALLAELTRRPDVLPLAFHITYWDRLGWPDTLGDARWTARQRDHARRLGSRTVYTPQMVIAGQLDVVGSETARVLAVIEQVRERGEAVPIVLAGEEARLPVVSLERPAVLWLAAFDARHRVAIERGENAGRTLEHHNVVRELVELGAWDGEARVLALPAARLREAGRAGLALVAQDPQTGRVIALGALAL